MRLKGIWKLFPRWHRKRIWNDIIECAKNKENELQKESEIIESELLKEQLVKYENRTKDEMKIFNKWLYSKVLILDHNNDKHKYHIVDMPSYINKLVDELEFNYIKQTESIPEQTMKLLNVKYMVYMLGRIFLLR
jgi:hypothetical protein